MNGYGAGLLKPGSGPDPDRRQNPDPSDPKHRIQGGTVSPRDFYSKAIHSDPVPVAPQNHCERWGIRTRDSASEVWCANNEALNLKTLARQFSGGDCNVRFS